MGQWVKNDGGDRFEVSTDSITATSRLATAPAAHEAEARLRRG